MEDELQPVIDNHTVVAVGRMLGEVYGAHIREGFGRRGLGVQEFRGLSRGFGV